MYEGFSKEWLVSVIAYAIIGKLTGLGWFAAVALAVLLGFLTAASFILLPVLRLPVNFITVAVLLIVVNTLLIYLATAFFHVGEIPCSLKHALFGGLGVSVIRGVVWEAVDRIIPED